MTDFPTTYRNDMVQAPLDVDNAIMASKLKELETARQQMQVEEMRRNLPLQALQRQQQTGVLQGQIERQPDVNAREAELAGAARKRTPTEIELTDLMTKNKIRLEQQSKLADEMDMFVQAFDPVLAAHKSQDYTAINEAWDSAFDLLDKKGINTEKMRQTPRDQLLPKIQQKYSEALNNASAIRARVVAEQKHADRMAELREQSRSRERVAATRAADDKPAGSEGALAARLMERYGKGTEIKPEEAQIIIRHYEEPTKSEMDAAWDDRQRAQIRAARKAAFERQFPALYDLARGGKSAPKPLPNLNIKEAVEAQGETYEPKKYHYRINPNTGQVEKAKK